MNRYRLFVLLSLLVLLAALLPGMSQAHAEPAPTLAAEGAPAETGVPADWWATVQDEIRRAEYEITGVDGTYQAPNRAQNLRTYFAASGPLVVPRVLPEGTETPPWRWGLHLAAWGWEGALQPIGAPTLHPDGNRMEYHYPAQSSIVEWYVNDERGLEQEFTLPAPPSPWEGEGLGVRVVLELALSGDLIPSLAPDGQAVEFSTAAGARILRYANLYAYDATGHSLPAHLELSSPSEGEGPGVRVVVDATAAAYPITIDPLLATPGWTFESNQANAMSGYSVAGVGDLNGDGYDDLAVGAPYSGSDDRGLVLVFYGSADGPPTNYSVRLDGSSAGANFGIEVGPAGDVNGDGDDDLIAGALSGGYAAVYYGTDSGLDGPWLATGTGRFGNAVGTAGDVNGDGYDDIIVGAEYADPLATDSGAAYVWLGSSTGLGNPGTPANADWSATSGQANAHFGHSVATAGDLNYDGYDDIVVGAWEYDNPDSAEGAVFVWYGSASGLGAPGLPANADWWAQSNQFMAHLGSDAGAAGDVNGDGYSDLIASAPNYDSARGRAYVFYGASGGLSCGGGCPVDANTAADWIAEGSEDASLGFAAASAGDVDGDGYDDVVLGAPSDPSGQEGAGRAYLYHGSANGLSHDAAWSEGGGQEWENYGWSVTGAGDVNGDGNDDLLVGAPLYAHDQTDEGRACLYYGSPLALLTEAAWSTLGGQKGAHLGSSVDTAGDLNGDGFSDVVVGVPNFDNATLGGRVFVYYGSAAGLPGAASWTATSDQALGRFGDAVATAGDFNGDGYADLAIGAPGYDHGGLGSAGAAFVYFGSAGGLGDPGSPSNADWAAYGDQASAEFGGDLGTAGDVNRDGYDDLIVGAPFYNAEWGRAYVYHGGANPDTTADWLADSPQAEGEFGYSVDTAGDVNRDGYADVIVGAPHAAYTYVYFGSAGGLAASPSWESSNTQGDSQAGYAVSTAGDTNGDGYSDVLIGAPQYDSDGLDRGRVYVCFGSATLPTCTWLFDGGQPNGRFGNAVSTAGDVNGDGYADMIVGAPYADDGGGDTGRAYVFYGRAGSPDAGHGWAVSGRANSWLGGAVGTAGDVNGDGYADVIVGAPLYSDAEYQEGWAGVYYGAPAAPGAVPNWTAQETQADTHLGDAVGTAGDVDGDGYADVIVGAPLYDGGQTDEGKVYVYLGDAGGLGTAPAWTAESNQAGARFGAAVGTAGDVNGDGYSDVVAGAPAYDDTSTDEGRAFVWYGSETGLGANGTPANADWQFWGIYGDNYLGSSVGTAGDVNGDGFADLIVGAPGFDGSELDQGRVCVFHGSAAGLSGVAWEVYGEQASAFLGSAVGTAGDVNGDSYSDVVIGASDYTGSETHEGRVYVYHGSASGLAATPAATLDGGSPNAYLGGSVGTAGDVDGDGYADVIAGARSLSADQLYEGRATVYYGSATGIGGGSTPWQIEGNQFGAYLGTSVGTAGDVNGDGYADVIIGAEGYDAGESDEGRVYLYFGSPDGLGYAPAWQVEGNQTDAHVGLAVGTAGDVNGDGYADLIVGSGGYSSGGDPEKQRAYVVYGNDGGGHTLRPRQAQLNGEPLAPLGLSGSCSTVKLYLNTWMPLGRERVKLEWQIAPLGTPFDAASGVVSGVSPSWAESQGGTAAFSPEVAGLSGETAYHWRVRLLYDPGNRLGQAASPWWHVPWNAWTEQDFRTPSCQVYLPLVVRNNQ
jgi:hypothetical protein